MSVWSSRWNTRQIIAHRKRKENKQPENARNDKKTYETRAVTNVHKIEHDECGFGKRDSERDQCIRARKDSVQIYNRNGVSQNRADYKHRENE